VDAGTEAEGCGAVKGCVLAENVDYEILRRPASPIQDRRRSESASLLATITLKLCVIHLCATGNKVGRQRQIARRGSSRRADGDVGRSRCRTETWNAVHRDAGSKPSGVVPVCPACRTRAPDSQFVYAPIERHGEGLAGNSRTRRQVPDIRCRRWRGRAHQECLLLRTCGAGGKPVVVA